MCSSPTASQTRSTDSLVRPVTGPAWETTNLGGAENKTGKLEIILYFFVAISLGCFLSLFVLDHLYIPSYKCIHTAILGGAKNERS